MEGTVKWFDVKKGYGFIEREGGEGDLFVHYSDVEGGGFRALDEGDNVTFEIGEGPGNRPTAKNVTKQ